MLQWTQSDYTPQKRDTKRVKRDDYFVIDKDQLQEMLEAKISAEALQSHLTSMLYVNTAQ